MPPSNNLTLDLVPLEPGDTIAGFSIGAPEARPLVDFFKTGAHIFEAHSLARSYVLREGGNRRIYGYLTLVCGEVKLAGQSISLGDGHVYPYKSFPALKLARLLVDAGYRRSGLGRWLVDFALGIAKNKICPAVGCRFLVVDSKPDSISFYEKTGFTLLDTDENKGRRQPLMFLDLHKASL